MRISTSKTELQSALNKLAKATPARSTLPILSCVLFSVDERETILRTTDLEITIITKLASTIEQEGSAAIPIQTLSDITNALPEGRITIEVKENKKVELISETGVYDLMGKSADEFPALPDLDGNKNIGMESDSLKKIIEMTLFAVSKDELKPSLTGVYFNIENEQLTAVATDGHRLVRIIQKGYVADEFKGSIIVPRKFLGLIHNMLFSSETIQMKMSKNHLTASIGKDIVYTRVIDERYPDYESVIPLDNDKSLTTEKALLLGAVKRVSIFSNKSTQQIALLLTKESILITTEDPEQASKAEETLAGEYNGEDLRIGYNAHYLKDIVSHISSNSMVIKLKTPISAALFYSDDVYEDMDITMLLMPIRLND